MSTSIPRKIGRTSCFFLPDLDVVVDAEMVGETVEEDNTVVEGIALIVQAIKLIDGRGVDDPVEVTALVSRIVGKDAAKEALLIAFVVINIMIDPIFTVGTLYSCVDYRNHAGLNEFPMSDIPHEKKDTPLDQMLFLPCPSLILSFRLQISELVL